MLQDVTALIYMYRTSASLLQHQVTVHLFDWEQSLCQVVKNALCLEMAYTLTMVNHGQTMVMPETLFKLHVLPKRYN